MHLPHGKNGIVLIVALIALIIPILLLEQAVLHHTSGNIVFPLDSAWLDISVAKNLAYYKVWGVSKYAFQSATSSLLYPFALAVIFFITGAHLVIPVVFNSLAAIYFLYRLQQPLIDQGFKPAVQLVILLAVIALGPLPLLVVSGMEYVLQLLLCFLFMETLAKAIQQESSRLPRAVYIYGLLAVATRYEDFLLIALACLLLTLANRRTQALRLAAIALLPVILFGIISFTKGSYFFPNSLLLGPYPGYTLLLTALAMVIAIGLIWQIATQQSPTSIYQLSFVLLCILALPFTIRNISALSHFRQDCVRIYEQQYPLAGFVHRYYQRQTVGVNDIGAVAYFSEGRKLDFTGVASADVTRIRKEDSWGPLWADSLSRLDGIRAAIVSDPWFSEGQFPRWNRIASWKIPGTTYSAPTTLSFFVINKYDTTWLRKNLRAYEPLLPDNIVVRYY
jgi:hypothetical protein